MAATGNRSTHRHGPHRKALSITSLLRDTKSLRFSELLQRLAVSPATLKRDLKYLREQLGTPIAYDAFERSYKIAGAGQPARKELPGLWFSESELNQSPGSSLRAG